MEWLDQQVIAALLSVFSTTASALALVYLQPKVRLYWTATHQFAHSLERKGEDPWGVFTRTILISNVGGQAATNVEIVLELEPYSFRVWPPCEVTGRPAPDDYHIINIPKLWPKTVMTVEFLELSADVDDAPGIIEVRSDQGIAKLIATTPQRVFPRWFRTTYPLLALVGLGFVLYWVFFIVLSFIPGV